MLVELLVNNFINQFEREEIPKSFRKIKGMFACGLFSDTDNVLQ
jgi:catalase